MVAIIFFPSGRPHLANHTSAPPPPVRICPLLSDVSKSMEYTVFRNLKRRRLLEEYIHEKRRKYDNEAIENDLVRSYLVTTTAIINSKTSRKPRLE